MRLLLWWRRAGLPCLLLVLLVCLPLLSTTGADESPTGHISRPGWRTDEGSTYNNPPTEVELFSPVDQTPIASRTPAAAHAITRDFGALPSRPEELSAAQFDSRLLHELDRLIELHQRKVDVLLRMRQETLHTQSIPLDSRIQHSANAVSPAPMSVDSGLSATDAIPLTAAKQPRHSRPRSSSSSEPFTLSNAIPQLVQRAAVFLAAIAVLVVYQYVQHKRSQQQPATATTSRAWEDEWMARRRRREALEQPRRTTKVQDVAGVRRRRTGAEVGGRERYEQEEEGKELRVESEVYEERDSVEWDEAAGDYWDASVSRHDGYVGVFGVEDEEKEEAEEDEQARSGGEGITEQDINDDDDEYEEEEEAEDEELPDDDEQG